MDWALVRQGCEMTCCEDVKHPWRELSNAKNGQQCSERDFCHKVWLLLPCNYVKLNK